MDTTPYIFLYKLTQARTTHSIVSHIFSKTLFSLVSSLVFFSSLFLIVYLSLIFFLSLYYFLRATSLDLIYFLIFLLMLKGLLHAKAMELINETISAHREELLAFLSRYDVVRFDKYILCIQKLFWIIWFWLGIFGCYRLGGKPRGIYKTKQLL